MRLARGPAGCCCVPPAAVRWWPRGRSTPLRHVHLDRFWSRRCHSTAGPRTVPARTPRRCGPSGKPLDEVWHRRRHAANGNLYTVHPSRRVSSPQAWLYLPPAYLATPRASCRDGHARGDPASTASGLTAATSRPHWTLRQGPQRTCPGVVMADVQVRSDVPDVPRSNIADRTYLSKDLPA